MTQISCIVEGHGEVAALPILLRRLGHWRSDLPYVEVLQPIRVSRSRFLNRDAEFRRHLLLAGSKCGDAGWVLVVLDADDDCPAILAPELLVRARNVLPHRSVSIVLAKREFEAWYVGAAESLNGFRGLQVESDDLRGDPEGPRSAKDWLGSRMGTKGYGETTDQPAFAATMDLEQAFVRCRSFRKLCDEWDSQFS